MRSQLRPALVALGIFTLLTGLVYPLVVTGIAQVVYSVAGQWQPHRPERASVGLGPYRTAL